MKTEKIKKEEDFSAIRKKWIKIGRNISIACFTAE